MQAVRARTDFVPSIALVLGSGLGQYAQEMDLVYEIPYADIPRFPCSTVAGHDGRYLFGYVAEVPVVAMKRRVHYYECYDIGDVVMPIRTMGLLGAKTLLANAAGGMSTDCEAIEAKHIGMKMCGISCITNMPAGILDQPLDHKEVQEVADRVQQQFKHFMTAAIQQLQ